MTIGPDNFLALTFTRQKHAADLTYVVDLTAYRDEILRWSRTACSNERATVTSTRWTSCWSGCATS